MKSKCKKALLVLLSVCMVLTMTPAAFATDTQAATEEGSSDSNVITADTTTLISGTYTLSADVTLANGALTVPSGADVTLNLGVYKLTNKNGEDTIVVQLGGKLTIEGTGTVDNVSHGRAAIYNSGTVVLNGGTYDRSAENGQNKNSSGDNSYYTILNHGTMTINNGVAVTTAGGESLSSKGRYSSLISNGYFSYTDTNPRNGYVETSNEAAPSLTISGGTFAGGLNTIKNDDGGNLTITGGTFSNFYQALVQNHNIAEITGGTFTAASDANGIIYGVDNCGCVATTDLGTLTISSGTFSGVTCGVWDRSSQPAQIAISGGTFKAGNNSVDKAASSKATISITGGTFSSDVKEFVPQNYECVVDDENDTYTVQKLEGKLVVKPGTDGGTDTVSAILEGDFTSNAEIDTGEDTETDVSGNDVTIDLTSTAEEGAGNTITTATLTVTADTAKSMATGGATLTVKSNVGTVSLPADAVKKMENANDEVTVSITKNTISNGVKASYTVNVKSGDKKLLPEGATDNGTITITVDKPADVKDLDLQAWYAVQDDENLVYVEELKTQIDGDQVAITIGHLSTIVLTDGDPVTGKAVATVTNDGVISYYSDLSKAIESAAGNSTVTLKADIELTGGIEVDKKLTLDLNGHTITNAEGWTDGDDYLIAVKRSGDLTINDSTGKGAVTTTKESILCGVKMTVQGEDASSESSAILTVNGGTIQGYAYGISGNGNRHGTQVTVNGGTITASNSDGVAIYQPQDGELTINGGNIKSANTAIEIRSGSLTVTGGMISGGMNEPLVNANSNGATTTNTGIAIAQHTTKKPINVRITGGNITGGAAVYESNPQNNDEDCSVSVSMENVTLSGNVKSTGFGNVTMDTVTVDGNVTKADSTTGELVILNSTITGTLSTGENNAVTIVNTTAKGETVEDSVADKTVATVSGKGTFESLQAAVDAAGSGDIVTLLSDVTLDGAGKENTQGLLTIAKDIILEGNGKTITAKDVTVTGSDGPSMINIENGANVTVRNLTIDGKGVEENAQNNTKHGLNIYGAGTSVTVENVTIKNGNGYAIVANGSTVTVDGLITENNSWGGINVDSKSGAASLTIKDADISENNSVKIENSASGAKPDDPAVEIRNGSFQHITKGGEIDKPNLTISGGKFATDSAEGAINVKDYLAPGLSISSDGTVYRPSTGGGGSVTTYPVTVSSADNGAVTVSPKNASKGSTVTVTVTPDEGYKLNTLTVKDKDGNAVELKDAGDGKYTFTMPSGKVTVEASFAEASQEPEPSGLPFTDVAASAWYREAVEYVYDNGMMKGTSDTIFSPDATTTRGMIVTMLYRLEGEPTASAASSFSDVKADDYYADAVSWAAENSIVNGVSATSYAPDDPITREQMAAILYRYAQFKGYDVTASADLSAYTDTSEISAYAVPAMQWANAEGLVTGRTNTTLDPEGDATRAEIATIMTRFCETIAK